MWRRAMCRCLCGRWIRLGSTSWRTRTGRCGWSCWLEGCPPCSPQKSTRSWSRNTSPSRVSRFKKTHAFLLWRPLVGGCEPNVIKACDEVKKWSSVVFLFKPKFYVQAHFPLTVNFRFNSAALTHLSSSSSLQVTWSPSAISISIKVSRPSWKQPAGQVWGHM